MRAEANSRVSNLFALSGKTAVVTGASYGLGVTFAEALPAAGANVILAARSRDKLDQSAARIAEHGGCALGAPCNVAVSSEVNGYLSRRFSISAESTSWFNNTGIAADPGIMPERSLTSCFCRHFR